MSRAPLCRQPTPAGVAVSICITGVVATVSFAPLLLLRATLEAVATEFLPGGPQGVRHEQYSNAYWQRRADGTATVPAGLVPRLVTALKASGHHVDVDDQRRFAHRCDGWREAAGVIGAELVSRLVVEPRGLVEAAGRDTIDVVAGVAWLVPTARVLVVAKNRKLARYAYRQLKWQLGNQVGHSREHDAFTHRVVVTSLLGLAHATPYDFDIVVALDAWAATRRTGREGLIRLGLGRVYGCVPPGGSLCRRKQMTLETYFGPMLHRDPKNGAFVGVRVVMAIPPWSPPVLMTDALMRKRVIWRDDARNHYIAAVATALSARDEAALFTLGLPNVLPPGAVAVLIESPEHGRILRRFMSNWPLVVAGDPDSPLPPVAILTLAAAAERQSLDVGVLVRADGGAGLLGINGFPPLRALPCSTVMLVDLVDDADSEARRATAGRIAWYELRGWQVVGRPAWTRALCQLGRAAAVPVEKMSAGLLSRG